MSQNLVRNGSFSDGKSYWTTYGWYPGNTIEFLASGGEDGACVKLTVPFVGDPGQSSIYQYIPMMGGHTYTVSFYAKRLAGVDIWVELDANGNTVFSPSLVQNIPADGNYHQVSAPLTVPGTANVVTRARLRLIAGSAGGTAWFDSVEIMDDKMFFPSYYVETNEGIRIHKQAAALNDNYGVFHTSAKFVYNGVDGDWVKVLFGTSSGTSINAYIHKSDCWNSNTLLEPYPEYRMVTIAKSLVGVTGDNIGLGGSYCENFIHWLAGASGLSHNIYCGDAHCGPAVRYYSEAGVYDVRNGSTPLLMQAGDIAYYDVVNYGTDQVTAAHAGYVVDVNVQDNTYTAIEGNVSNSMVKTIEGDRTSGINAVHGHTLHGVAHPSGRG